MILTPLVCLALNIYFEARNEDYVGQMMVAEVTINRKLDERFPDTICDVVYQNNQFSWTHDGKSDEPKETEAYAIATVIAKIAMRHEPGISPLNTNVLFYHADYAKPHWSKVYKLETRVGRHLFYSTDKL